MLVCASLPSAHSPTRLCTCSSPCRTPGAMHAPSVLTLAWHQSLTQLSIHSSRTGCLCSVWQVLTLVQRAYSGDSVCSERVA